MDKVHDEMHFVHKYMKHFEFQFINKFFRWFRQSWIPNLWIFLANICFSSSKLRKETCFGPIRNLLSLWINKICKKICENIWWICYMKIFAFQFQIVQFNSQFKYKVYLRYFKSDGLFSFYLLIDFVLVLPTIFFTAFQQCEKKAISDGLQF